MRIMIVAARKVSDLGFLAGAPGRIRTRDPLLRRQPLCPAELQAPGYLLCIAKVTHWPRYGVGPVTVTRPHVT